MCISGVCVRRVLSAGGGHGVWQPRAACRDTSRSCLQDGRRGDFALTYKQKSVETFWRRHTRPYCQCSCPRRYWRCLLLFFNGATQTGATECGRNSSSSSQTDSRFLHCHWQTDRQINRQTDRQAGLSPCSNHRLVLNMEAGGVTLDSLLCLVVFTSLARQLVWKLAS